MSIYALISLILNRFALIEGPTVVKDADASAPPVSYEGAPTWTDVSFLRRWPSTSSACLN